LKNIKLVVKKLQITLITDNILQILPAKNIVNIITVLTSAAKDVYHTIYHTKTRLTSLIPYASRSRSSCGSSNLIAGKNESVCAQRYINSNKNTVEICQHWLKVTEKVHYKSAKKTATVVVELCSLLWNARHSSMKSRRNFFFLSAPDCALILSRSTANW